MQGTGQRTARGLGFYGGHGDQIRIEDSLVLVIGAQQEHEFHQQAFRYDLDQAIGCRFVDQRFTQQACQRCRVTAQQQIDRADNGELVLFNDIQVAQKIGADQV